MNAIEVYESIKNTSYGIYTLYKKLEELEIEGKESTIEYEKVLKAIEQYTQIENNYYEILEKMSEKDNELPLNLGALTLIDAKSSFGQFARIGEVLNIIFNDFEEDDIIPMRMNNKIFEIYLHIMTNEDDMARKQYEVFEAQKEQYFIDILSSMIKDKNYQSYRKELIKAKYKIAFINRKRNPQKPGIDFSLYTPAGFANIIEIIEYAKKIYRLNENEIFFSGNIRSILLSSAYIRANLMQMDDVCIETLKLRLDETEKSGEITVGFGKKIFEEILEYQSQDKKEFKDKGNALNRKF